MTLFEKFAAHVDHALDALVAAGTLPADIDRSNVTVEPPREASHGDLSTNAAMVLAKPAGTNPRALAEALSIELGKIDNVTAVEIAGPGFLNLRLNASAWLDELRAIGQLDRRPFLRLLADTELDCRFVRSGHALDQDLDRATRYLAAERRAGNTRVSLNTSKSPARSSSGNSRS